MQPDSRVSHIWNESVVTLPYTAGVSLHSHTSASRESLSFIHKMGTDIPLMDHLFAYYERVSLDLHGLPLDFLSANWRPPLIPRAAFDLERRQIQRLGLDALISITDHDTMEAPLLLRTLAISRSIPISVEWSTPFGATAFHLGIHNLPSADGLTWMRRFEDFTASPTDEDLHALLGELHAIPQVLIVLNHPIWDLHKIGQKLHEAELDRFLLRNGDFIHAFELNGLRHARENREVISLARRWSQLLISGGDRHGLEPNANINLTNATNFHAFVHEIRVERRSHVLFLEQYQRPWEQRILDSTLDVITDYAHFSPGWQRWDERAFHRDAEGVMRPMAELWIDGKPPLGLRVAIAIVRLLRYRTFAKALSPAFWRVNHASLHQEIAREAA